MDVCGKGAWTPAAAGALALAAAALLAWRFRRSLVCAATASQTAAACLHGLLAVHDIMLLLAAHRMQYVLTVQLLVEQRNFAALGACSVRPCGLTRGMGPCSGGAAAPGLHRLQQVQLQRRRAPQAAAPGRRTLRAAAAGPCTRGAR